MQIKLLQWNILYKEEIENIVKQIRKLNPDIICLQELGVNCKYNPKASNTAEYVAQKLGYNAFFKEAQRWGDDTEMDAIGNGIFARFPIIKTSFQFIQNQTKKFTNYSHEGRIYIEVNLQINNKKLLTVGTTHLSYTHKFEVTSKKKKEIGKLLMGIKEKKEHYIFTGDLNSIPTSYTVIQLSKYFQNCGPSFDQKTWTTKPFKYQDFEENHLRWRLDYIFATKDIRCLSSKIIKTVYSDHLPIFTVFKC